MNKRFFAGLLAVSMLTLVGCGAQEDGAAGEDTGPKGTAVETQVVGRAEIYNESELSGQIVANREVPVLAPLPSKVLSVNVKVGDLVKQGQVLFTLDKTDIQKNYQPLLDNYNRTKTLTDESIRLAQQNVDNTMALFEIGAASQAEIDQAKLALLQQQTQAASQLSQLDESMKDVNTTLKDATVKAPIAGVVTAVAVVENVNANPSSYAVMIAENQKPQISVSVSETLIPQINVGDPVEITVPAVSATPFTATIRSIAPSSNPQTQLYEVKIDVSAEAGYQVGMFANVKFRTNYKQDVVVIPSEAILTDGDTEHVYIVNDQGTASKVIVTTGLASGANTEITGGLAGGEQLVTKGQSYLSEGAQIRVTNAPAAAPAEAAAPAADASGAEG